MKKTIIASVLALTMVNVGCQPDTDAEDAPVSEAAPASEMAPVPDPADMQLVLDQHAALGPKPLETLTPAEARMQPSPADAVKAHLIKIGGDTLPEPVAKVVNRTIPGAAGAIPVRIYSPEGSGPFPVIVYTHGGGWVIATMDTYDASARALANAAGAVVVSIEYRKGPENRFPAAHDDAFAAYQWVLQNAASINGDPARIATAGESAGGNLAMAIALTARDRGVKLPVHILAVYPIADGDTESASYQQNANAKPLSKAGMQWFFTNAFSAPADAQDPRISLVKADLKGLPPVTVVTAEIDPLRSDGMELVEKLKQAGVPVEHRDFTGVTHEFFGMGAVLPEGKEAVSWSGQRLRSAFGN